MATLTAASPVSRTPYCSHSRARSSVFASAQTPIAQRLLPPSSLRGLVQPGFDPARGADAVRRYVTRKASIAVLEHAKAEHPERYPWTQVGISERRYYKLLPRFARKVNGRYDVVDADVVPAMRAHI